MNNITPIEKGYQALQAATKPEETKAIEGYATAGRAWAKEHKFYDEYVNYARLYVLARRKTTELVKPFIHWGGHNKQGSEQDTLLEDFAFTKSQWNRRCKELDIPEEQIEEYFHECFTNGWWPSINGLFRFKADPPDVEPCLCPVCGREHTKPHP